MGLSTDVLVIVGLVVAGTLLLISMFGRLFRKAGPNQALIVYGARGTRIIKGRGTVIIPMIETARELSLELMSFDVAPQQDLYTMQGVAVTVEAVAQIKVKSDPVSIQTAAEQFLTKSDQNREALIRLVMEGHLRGIIGQLTVEQIVKEPEMVGDRMRTTCAADLNKMGLEVISFTIKEVRDKNEYIANMGRPDIARVKRDAEIATAEAERDTAIRRAHALREAAISKSQADQERVLAETLSLTKQSEAQRDLEIKKAEYLETVKRQQAQADKAYDIQTSVMQQQLIAEQVKVQQIEKEHEILVQDAEIQRRERELTATVLKPAEMEGRRIQALASAEKQKLIFEAEGRATAIRAQGEAEAEITFKKGEAEAKAMNVKAEAYQEYNQAAVVDKLISSMPEIVRALASPLQNVDKITVISTGGETAGMNKITGDMAAMAAQIPALFETLSGMKMSELLGKVKASAMVRRTKTKQRQETDMALLERVGTLLRANVNDLIDRAEEPEKMLKQVILDMENQLMQVKTQLAITIADLHLLERRRLENIASGDDWMRKAELAVNKHQDNLARQAIERSLEIKKLAGSFDEQIADQKVQVENLKAALHQLEGKLAEARTKSEILLARHRRARTGAAVVPEGVDESAWDRMHRKVSQAESVSAARAELAGGNLEAQFDALEKQDEVDRLLAELKKRKEPQ